jgi:hypothetical protein
MGDYCHDRGPHDAYNPARRQNRKKFSGFPRQKDNTSPKRRVYLVGSSRETVRMSVAFALAKEGWRGKGVSSAPTVI